MAAASKSQLSFLKLQHRKAAMEEILASMPEATDEIPNGE